MINLHKLHEGIHTEESYPSASTCAF